MKGELNQTEKLILQEILDEKSSNDIAIDLGISITEIDVIRKSIYKKLDAKNGIGLLKKSIENNLYNKKP